MLLGLWVLQDGLDVKGQLNSILRIPWEDKAMQYSSFVRYCLCLVFAGVVTAGHAQDWPKRPVRVVVPFAAGSTPDLVARIISDRLAHRLGRPMVVDNKPGAAGNTGTDAVAKAAPDGHTIGVSIAGPLAVNPLLFRTMPYDPARDIAPVTIAATQPAVLVVSEKVAATQMSELLALLRNNKGKYNFSSMGAGTISHLAMEALSSRTDAGLVHVPYGGSGAAVRAVLSDEVEMALLPASAVMPHIKIGKIKALAVASAERSPSLPDLPTLAEAGMDDIKADAWIGFIAPAKTAPEIQRRLHDEIVQVLAEPAIMEKLRLQYMDPIGNSPAEFRSVLAADAARWKQIIEMHSITME
jgi:tripartite-type tricarboxylate transporter receptor subunit TctC